MDRSDLLDFIFPPRCAVCERFLETHSGCCESCFQEVKIDPAWHCAVCRARLPEGRKICHHDSPFILGIVAPYAEKTVQTLILRLKFDAVRDAARPLAELVTLYLRPLLSDPSFVMVPIPLGKRRERLRGYNQSVLIGERVATALGVSFRPDLLRRVRETGPQSELDRSARLANLESAFAAADCSGLNIILLDDVVTSGATLRSAASALQKAGADRILAIAVAGA